ncbi:disease resistance protein RGA2-like isoform X7 [Hevea brasiliensis]|uniref:disease resistance protein RGA2-like isoform X7 n=1 Tax=Hevea brasiliensis TaxID=3981 RepID=UPI0025CF41A8|nr:disease resistance protein RGA2-like isoform X7 [Hevea brasiliensis]
MAPKIFSLLVDATLSWVLSLIIYQIILAWNLNDDSKGLQDSLTMIRAVLQDADEQQHRREPVRLWLKKLKDVAYEGEAVLNKLKNDDIRQMVEMLDQSGTELWNFMKGMLGDSLPYSTSRETARCKIMPDAQLHYFLCKFLLLFMPIGKEKKSFN